MRKKEVRYMRVEVRRKRSPSVFLVPVALLVVVGIVVAFFLSGKLDEIFKNGEISCGEGVSLAICQTEEKFKTDYEIVSERSTDKGELVHEVYVPTTDFYSEKQALTQAEFLNLDKGSSTEVELTKLSELSADKKMLGVENKYYLDDFTNGAYFENYVVKGGEKADETEIANIRGKIKGEIAEMPGSGSVLTINQTGVTALSREMQSYMNRMGVSGEFFAEKVKTFLSSTDITHISNEVSFASDCTTNSATVVLCSPWEMYDAVTVIGTDVVELTGNHNNDWGKEANVETIEKYRADGMKVFGGGENEKQAVKPLDISEKGTEIEWIGVNYSTSTKENGQGADGENPGANIYDEAETRAQITDAKAAGKFVIVDIQFSECYSYPEMGAEMPSCDAPIAGQVAFFRGMIEMGADMVVGTQAHQPQTYEIYQGKPIYYGLGNLFFDQISWPGTTRSIILTHYFYKGKLLQTKLSPTQYGSDFQTEIMTQEETEKFLRRLLESSPEGK
ncbi:MAG: CapA family protein [Candidatus Saccharibacteria bacterium]|nr:CapA family protein [Candidatus Saccharibacteria bacterium]